MRDDKKRRIERHLDDLSAGLRVFYSAVLAAGAVLLANTVTRSIEPPASASNLPWLIPTTIAVVLAVNAILFYGAGSKAQAYRAATGALFSSLAAVLYAGDPSWNVQNVLMGIGVLIAIAAIVVPPLRHGASPAKAPHHRV
jgi:hypothetical protein